MCCLPAALADAPQGASKIGINIKLNMMPGPQRFQVILDHKPHLGIQVLGQAPGLAAPDASTSTCSTRARQAAPGTRTRRTTRTRTVDKLIAQGLATSDLKVAARNALKIMQIIATDVPYIPVFMFPGAWAVEPGWEFKSSLGPFFYNQIWLSTSLPSSGSWHADVRRAAAGVAPDGGDSGAGFGSRATAHVAVALRRPPAADADPAGVRS